jgi:hypothetical protein
LWLRAGRTEVSSRLRRDLPSTSSDRPRLRRARPRRASTSSWGPVHPSASSPSLCSCLVCPSTAASNGTRASSRPETRASSLPHALPVPREPTHGVVAAGLAARSPSPPALRAARGSWPSCPRSRLEFFSAIGPSSGLCATHARVERR